MHPSRNRAHPLMATVAALLLLLLILCFTLFPSSSVGLLVPSIDGRREDLGRRKMVVVGSRPPRCVNKCSSCRPCMAALVIIGRQEKKGLDGVAISGRREEDDSYYLLSWKCRCKDKIFPP